VRVDVRATAVTLTDVITRQGYFIAADQARFPMLLGWEAAGTVDTLGPGVDDLAASEEVLVFTPQALNQLGTYAEQIVVPAEGLARRPTGLDPVPGSTLPLSGLTAAQAVEATGCGAGSSLLIIGALGAVGLLATQLARHAGIEVLASVRAEQANEARELGVKHAIDRDGDICAQVRDIRAEGVDAVISTVGAGVWSAALEAIRDGGRLVHIVPGDAPPPQRGIAVTMVYVQPDRALLERLAGMAADGTLDTRVRQVLPLEEAGRAHELVAGGAVGGRIVLTP
jgi:NADPH2:quinone reductase